LETLKGQKNFLFFSHTIKAQPHNMAMLDHILQEKCRLFDYECITRNGSDTEPRLVAFGKFAGTYKYNHIPPSFMNFFIHSSFSIPPIHGSQALRA
jgi:hypothetical protein